MASNTSLSVQEVAAALGVAQNTVRRWFKAGRLRSEHLTAPEGSFLRVQVETGDPLAAAPLVADAPEYGHRPLDVQRMEAMAEYNKALMAPLVDELSRVQSQLADAAERVGRLESELAAARERIRSLESGRRDPTWRILLEIGWSAGVLLIAALVLGRFFGWLPETLPLPLPFG